MKEKGRLGLAEALWDAVAEDDFELVKHHVEKVKETKEDVRCQIICKNEGEMSCFRPAVWASTATWMRRPGREGGGPRRCTWRLGGETMPSSGFKYLFIFLKLLCAKPM